MNAPENGKLKSCPVALRCLLLITWSVSVVAAPEGSGPYPASILSEPSLDTHTIYRPANLDELGGNKLPIVAWGNGACVNANFTYREFLAEIASHGFLVVAIGPYLDAAPPRPERRNVDGVLPPNQTSTGLMIDAINWAISMNRRTGSDYAGRIDEGRIAVMGHSCGGLQALEASYDKRVSTTVVLNSGIFDDGNEYLQRFSLDRSMLKTLHAPVGYFIGGEEDIAYSNAEKDWPFIEVLSVKANLPVGHGATYSEENGGSFVAAPLAWLKWQLQDDESAAAMFRGANCGFCENSEWELVKRGFE